MVPHATEIPISRSRKTPQIKTTASPVTLQNTKSDEPKPTPDPEVQVMIESESARLGVERREISVA